MGLVYWFGWATTAVSGLRARFALYVTGYSAFRIFEESLRVDYSQYFLQAASERLHYQRDDSGGVGVVSSPPTRQGHSDGPSNIASRSPKSVTLITSTQAMTA